MRTFILSAAVAALALVSPAAAQQASEGPLTVEPAEAAAPRMTFLGRFHTPLHPPIAVTETLLIFHPKPGGWLVGPRLRGALADPGGDWVRTLPDGDMRIDVRATAILDDGSPLAIQYNGVLARPDAESWSQFLQGQRINAPQWHYVIAPTFETGSERYGWLNHVQAVGKFVSIQTGPDAHISFDLYAVE